MAKLPLALLYPQVYPYTYTVTIKLNFRIIQSLVKSIFLEIVNQRKLNSSLPSSIFSASGAVGWGLDSG